MSFLHADRLGTPQLATDSSQNALWSTTYQPFGTTGIISGSITQSLRLPGQYADVETGFNHNGFRDYMPNLGRYIEADPSGFTGGPNLYGYAAQNPTQRTDRLGLQEDENGGEVAPAPAEEQFEVNMFRTNYGQDNFISPAIDETTRQVLDVLNEYLSQWQESKEDLKATLDALSHSNSCPIPKGLLPSTPLPTVPTPSVNPDVGSPPPDVQDRLNLILPPPASNPHVGS